MQLIRRQQRRLRPPKVNQSKRAKASHRISKRRRNRHLPTRSRHQLTRSKRQQRRRRKRFPSRRSKNNNNSNQRSRNSSSNRRAKRAVKVETQRLQQSLTSPYWTSRLERSQRSGSTQIDQKSTARRSTLETETSEQLHLES